MKDPYVIAEAGTNHNGDINTAIKLIDVANEAGANSVKFQIIYPEGLYLPYFYKDGKYEINEVIEIRKKYMINDFDYETLANHAKELDIDFSASVFDSKSLNLLLKFDPQYIKIASCDLNNIYFLKTVAQFGIKMIISCGMSTLGEIENSVNELEKIGFNDIVLLHCVSVYPATLDIMNLSFISKLKEMFHYPIGLSDHTSNNSAAVMALVMGANYFEKHFTLDKTQEGFDHSFALEKKELTNFVNDIKNGNLAMLPVTNKLTNEEILVKKRARRSLFASRDILAGEIVKMEDILIVRPEGIMDANQFDQISEKKIARSIKKYQPFSLDYF